MLKLSHAFWKGALLCMALMPLVSSAQETQRQYLSGTDKDHTVPWRFFCSAGAQSGYWTNIPVPANWEMRGFGTLTYQRDLTNTPVETGEYETYFSISTNWGGRRIFLVFEGVMTDTRVVLNGKAFGPTHQGGFYRFKYDVTRAVQFTGTNLLQVSVAKRSANDSVNAAERAGDYWLFGGIYRPVYLEAVPMDSIDRVAIDAQADGRFSMNVFSAAESGTVEARIFDSFGQPAGPVFSQELSGNQAVLETRVNSPRCWTAETPNLYVADVRLVRNGKVAHHLQQRFGFRTFEVRPGDGFYLNGHRIVLKGANRHSFWPESGRTLSETVHRMDIALLKGMNMNAVRMSHYPPDAQFLDLCDELGLYVLDELGGWQHYYDAEVGHTLIREMVTRDVNHPSILFWDNGNEGGWNTNLDDVFAQWDPQQRHVVHPWNPDVFKKMDPKHRSVVNPYDAFRDIDTSHYRSYSNTVSLCAGTNIFMPTEFLHALYDGGAGAGMEDYWDVMRRSRVLGGGFIWALLDEGVRHPDTHEIDVHGNEAPDGIVGPYREKEGSYYTIKELWSPMVVTERTLPADFNGTLTIENRYDFTDASQCSFTWSLRKFSGPKEPVGFTEIAGGKAVSPKVAPGSTGTIHLNLPVHWQQADALSLSVADPADRELWTYVWPLSAGSLVREETRAASTQPVIVRNRWRTILVKTGGLEVVINKKTGFLSQVTRNGKPFSFSQGPRPADSLATLTNIECHPHGTSCDVVARYTGGLDTVTWHVEGNGWVRCDYTYSAEGPKDFMGVVFDYPESLVLRKKWLGDGPYRVWKNRLPGATAGVWETGYNNSITGWSGWNYSEFKGCFANVRWMRLETLEGPITAVLDRNDQYVQVLNPEFPPFKKQAHAAMTLPRAGVGILDAIPAMGNKFMVAAKTGPHGQPTQASGQYSGSVSFYFGELP